MATTMPTWRSVGTVASGTGAVSPGIPTGTTTNDIMLLFAESNGEAISAPGGWSQINTGTTTGVRLTVFWKRATASEAAPTVADPGNHVIARIHSFSGCTPVGSPIDTSTNGFESTSDTSGSAPAITTSIANCLVVVGAAGGTDPLASDTAGFSAWTNANLSSLTERSDDRRIDGDGGYLGVAVGGKATAGSTGNTTMTYAANNVKAFVVLALKPVPEFIDEINDGFDTLSTTTGMWASSYGTVSVSSGEVHTQTISTYSGIKSFNTFNFTGRAMQIKTVSLPTGGNGGRQSFMQAQIDNSNKLEIGVLGANIYAKYTVGGTDFQFDFATYNATTHKYWRIRESGGTTFWDYSSNGNNWTNAWSVSNPIAVTSLIVNIGSGYTGTETSPPDFVFDEFNYHWGADTSTGTEGTPTIGFSQSDTSASTETATIRQNVSDTATSTETASSTASLTHTDTATSTEAVASIALSGSDTSTGTESSTISATFTQSDTSSGTEAVAIVAVSSSDTSSATETQSVDEGSVPITSSDTASGTDAHTLAPTVSDISASAEIQDISATLSATDTGSVTETATSSASQGVVDTNAATETQSIVVSVSSSDTGSSTETQSTSASLTQADTGSGTETATVATASSDTATGTETTSIAAQLSATDTSSGTEADPVVAFTQTDTGSSADTEAVSTSVTGADIGSSTDNQTIGINSVDISSGSEDQSLTASMSATDTSTMAEIAIVAVSSSDSVSGDETQSIEQGATPKNDSDSGSASETATLSAALSSADTSTAADSAVIVVAIFSDDSATATDIESYAVHISSEDSSTSTETQSTTVHLLSTEGVVTSEIQSSTATFQSQDTCNLLDVGILGIRALDTASLVSETHSIESIAVTNLAIMTGEFQARWKTDPPGTLSINKQEFRSHWDVGPPGTATIIGSDFQEKWSKSDFRRDYT